MNHPIPVIKLIFPKTDRAMNQIANKTNSPTDPPNVYRVSGDCCDLTEIIQFPYKWIVYGDDHDGFHIEGIVCDTNNVLHEFVYSSEPYTDYYDYQVVYETTIEKIREHPESIFIEKSSPLIIQKVEELLSIK